jgi:FkbH-like protein
MPPTGNVKSHCSISIAATFTAEPLREPLAFWLDELKWDCGIRFAPYNQVFQELLDPAGVLARNSAGLNVILVRANDWHRFQPLADSGEDLLANAHHLVECVRSAAAHYQVPTLVVLCPASHQDARSASAERVMSEGLHEIPHVEVAEASTLLDLYPVHQVFDEHTEQLGHIPYTEAFFAALGTFIVRRLHALRTPPFKAIVLDCDETLWRGICGEDDPEGVVLDQSRRQLQEFMAAQQRAGMLLCMASRNNEEDVFGTFAAHPEFPLRPADFAAWRINWQAKSSNLVELAGELNLGLDSLIFIDDNAQECAEVQADRPEVLVLPVPSSPETVLEFLRHVWAFDRARLTEEDRQRSSMYRIQAERAQSEKQASSLAEFIASLELKVEVLPVRPDQFARVAQLTQRTNQMNFTAVRRTEPELENLLRMGARCLAVEVTDRFGSYGLTGAVIYTIADARLKVDTFLLSCRVLGRGVEHRVMAALGALAGQEGATVIEIPFRPTARNRPARAFLDSIGAVGQEASLDVAVARELVFTPVELPPAVTTSQPVAPSGRERIDYRRIGTELRDVSLILAKMRQRRAAPEQAAAPLEGSVLEQQLAALWSELLGIPHVRLDDQFFDIGGHSFLAVQLLSRVRQLFGVELSLDVIYGDVLNVRTLAQAIELEQVRALGVDEYEALLKDIEQLSDEEAQAMLSKLTESESGDRA